jgi:hypothetical protein
MSSGFLRYSSEIETIDPHIDELIPQIIEFWEKKGHESPTTEGTGRAVRGAHASQLAWPRRKSRSLTTCPRRTLRASMPSPAGTAP